MTSTDAVTVPCASCGARNRLPKDRLRDDPICGSCKGKLFPRGPVEVTDASWHALVEQSPLPVLVDYWAPWCGPCRMVAPVLARVAEERAGQLKVVKLNIDQNPEVSSRYGVRSIPTIKLFHGGHELDELVGAAPKQHIDQFLDENLRPI